MDVAGYYDCYWRVVGPDPEERVMRDHFWFARPYLGKAVLEVGCGDGKFIGYMSREMDGAFVGVDISAVAISRARRAYPGFLWLCCDGIGAEIPDGVFDSVVAIAVLEHILDPEAVVADAAAVLKPGGHLIVVTNDFNWLKRALIGCFAWERYHDPWSPHIRHFTRRTLREMCGRCGLAPVAYEWDYSYCGVMPMGQRAVFVKE